MRPARVAVEPAHLQAAMLADAQDGFVALVPRTGTALFDIASSEPEVVAPPFLAAW
jgi:hypothetical protein